VTSQQDQDHVSGDAPAVDDENPGPDKAMNSATTPAAQDDSYRPGDEELAGTGIAHPPASGDPGWTDEPGADPDRYLEESHDADLAAGADDAYLEGDDVIVVAEVIDADPAADQNPGTAGQYPGAAVSDTSPAAIRTGTLPGAGRGTATDAVSGSDPVTGPDAVTGTNLSQQWHDIQARFVDDPADAVRLAARAAEAAVSELVTALQDRQSALVPGTTADGREDTEQLRSILRECRTFCQDVAEMGRRLGQVA
jgi:hypothetical protein